MGAEELWALDGERTETAYVEVLSSDLRELAPDYSGPAPERLRVTSGRIKAGWLDDIPKGGTLEFEDSPDLDWASLWLRPVYRARRPHGQWIDFPLGVYLPSTPTGLRTPRGAQRTVEMLDATRVLQQDEIVETFVVDKGENITEAVHSLIASVGLPPARIPRTEDVARILMAWSPATPKLRIVQDLLNAIHYTRLTMGWDGLLFSVKERAVSLLPDVATFSESGPQVYDDAYSDELDLNDVPNRWIGKTRADGEDESLVAVAENTDPESSTSYQARGNRWVTRTTTDLETTDFDTLELIVRQNLANATNALHEVTMDHPIYPLELRDIQQVHNAQHALHMRARVTHMDLTFGEAGSNCRTTSREVARL